ncbi:hypothetical protein BG000_005953, partial [Podila horticola]
MAMSMPMSMPASATASPPNVMTPISGPSYSSASSSSMMSSYPFAPMDQPHPAQVMTSNHMHPPSHQPFQQHPGATMTLLSVKAEGPMMSGN